jgi:tetratricopeptide (TPR) repeat protein
MWLKRRLERVCAHPGPILLEGGPAWGAPHLIAALAQPERPLVWLELQKGNDPVLLGNKLADAVRRALTGPLFGYGLPYHHGLSLLKTQLKLLGPFTFALSNAAYAPELARDLLSLHDGENRVILHFTPSCGGFALSEDALLVTPSDLMLELEEAKELARELPEPALHELWATSGGAYEAFLIALHERLSLPPPLRPGPEGWQVIPGLTPTAAPDPLIAALLHRGRWLEALELAAQERPERVPEVLAAAGEVPWTQGLQGRLYGLLATLPAEVGRQEVVLAWRFIAALASGKEREVIPEVKAALASGNRPDLHALYAEACCHLGNLEAALVEAERAVRAQETPITLYTYGRALALRDPENGLEKLERALRLS